MNNMENSQIPPFGTLDYFIEQDTIRTVTKEEESIVLAGLFATGRVMYDMWRQAIELGNCNPNQIIAYVERSNLGNHGNEMLKEWIKLGKSKEEIKNGLLNIRAGFIGRRVYELLCMWSDDRIVPLIKDDPVVTKVAEYWNKLLIELYVDMKERCVEGASIGKAFMNITTDDRMKLCLVNVLVNEKQLVVLRNFVSKPSKENADMLNSLFIEAFAWAQCGKYEARFAWPGP